MSDVEKIEADMKSILDALQCLERMYAIKYDRSLRRDFDIVWSNLTTLLNRLHRKLGELEDEIGAK